MSTTPTLAHLNREGDESSAEYNRRKVELAATASPAAAETVETYRTELLASHCIKRDGVKIVLYTMAGYPNRPLADIYIDDTLHGGRHRNVEPALRTFAALVEERRTPAAVTINDLLTLLETAATYIVNSADHFQDPIPPFALEIRAAVTTFRAQNPLDTDEDPDYDAHANP